MATQFNIYLKLTTAKSPWSYGMEERTNVILAKIIEKLILDHKNKYPNDVIIAWAVNAKNNLRHCYGFSPNHLVFGQNLSLLSILKNELTAL